MRYYLILKGTNKKFASLEFETLWKTYNDEKISLEQVKNMLYTFSSTKKAQKEMLERLTFTNYLGVMIKEHEGLEDYLNSKKDFSKYEGKVFAVKVRSYCKKKNTLTSKELAKPIWDNLENPNVDLQNPEVEFTFFHMENKLVLCERLFENDKEYLRRMPKLRPVAMPYTLKSDMARGAINLLELEKGVVLDPFCGIGGILLEAYDMSFDVVGNDISWRDLQHMKTNFRFYYPDANPVRILADCGTLFLREDRIDGIVTDIPYGKASKRLGLGLYESFLKNAKRALKPGRRLIVIYANFIEFKNIALKYFDEVEEIEHYINRSMTRYILILENTK